MVLLTEKGFQFTCRKFKTFQFIKTDQKKLDSRWKLCNLWLWSVSWLIRPHSFFLPPSAAVLWGGNCVLFLSTLVGFEIGWNERGTTMQVWMTKETPVIQKRLSDGSWYLFCFLKKEKIRKLFSHTHLLAYVETVINFISFNHSKTYILDM